MLAEDCLEHRNGSGASALGGQVPGLAQEGALAWREGLRVVLSAGGRPREQRSQCTAKSGVGTHRECISSRALPCGGPGEEGGC